MIVYGDAQFDESLSSLLTRLSGLLTRARGHPAGLDLLRSFLIACGQVEQAALDRPDLAPGLGPPLHALTACAARAFLAAWTPGGAPEQPDLEVLACALSAARAALASAPLHEGQRVRVKIPEGFAYYGLYPEQYCISALRWLSDHETIPDSERCILVAGIRSIGTSLSALAAEVLSAHGWQARCVSLRPTGHPFDRRAELDAEGVMGVGARWGLVVDEGPGMSGSSMAAVAEALVRAGIERSRIAFFPAHDGDPGSAAPGWVRDWWQTTSRYVTPLSGIRFGGLTLQQALAAEVPRLLQRDDPVISVQDLGGGLWRYLVYGVPSRWPPACAPFERPKYLCTTGSGARVLFKFEGLPMGPGGSLSTAHDACSLLRSRAAKGWGPVPLGMVRGFVALPWVEGDSLSVEDARPDLLARVGRYIVEAAGPALSPDEQGASLDRLSEMLYWNACEALGEAEAERSRPWSDAVRRELEAASTPVPSYGDGHMAPHEWLREPSGQVVKVDSAGHVHDHTCIGPQPLVWDIAGALVEWGVGRGEEAPLLDAFNAAGGPPIAATALHFYCMAYSAFRVGMCHMCASMASGNPDEETRLRSACARYRDELARLLATEPLRP